MRVRKGQCYVLCQCLTGQIFRIQKAGKYEDEQIDRQITHKYDQK